MRVVPSAPSGLSSAARDPVRLELDDPEASSAAPLAVTPVRTIPMQHSVFPLRPYTLASGGTFWIAEKTGTNSGQAIHLDDEGNNLGDGFSFNWTGFYPFSIAAYGNRLYITLAGGGGTEPLVLSYKIETSDPGHNLIIPDFETDHRDLGGWVRTYADGSATFAMGEKVAVVDLSNESAEHPFYPQAYFGAGINKGLNEDNTYVFESCALNDEAVVIGEPDPNCGAWQHGYGPGTPTGLDIPTDMAPAAGGVLITEKGADRVTHITTSTAGGHPDYEFSGPGEGAGQLLDPVSIVQEPNSSHYFVGEEGNRRVSVFNFDGGYIGSFGYGVSDGQDAMEVCGFEIGPCRSGVSSATDPRSSISRLDFGPEGDLYAFNQAANQIQVFSIGTGTAPGGGGSPGGGSSGSGSAGGASISQEPDKVRLRAAPLKVEKGAKTKLTAIVNPPATCASRKVLFQIKDRQSWENTGKAIRVGKSCQAKKKIPIKAKSVFRAVLITANSHTLANSPSVTVKLK